MADPKAQDVARTAEGKQPSPNEVAGYIKIDPDSDEEKYIPPVDPRTLDRDSHVTIVPRSERGEGNILAAPTADIAQD